MKKFKDIYQEQLDKRKDNLFLKRRTDYAQCYKKYKVCANIVLYESYMGRGMICNPYALFLAFKERDDFTKFEHYWTVENMEEAGIVMLRKKYETYLNVHFVERDSIEYIKVLTKAKYLINNAVFPNYFTKKEEQVYVNTWHGIPMKTLGYDIPGGCISNCNTVRNFLSTDYLISPNSFMTQCYKKSFRLEGLYQGRVLEEGQPRNDMYGITKKEDIIATLKEAGIALDASKQLILYAPTWKGEDYGNPDVSLEECQRFIKKMEEQLDTSKYQVLVKPHQVVYKYIMEQESFTEQLVPATIDTNELLSIVDVLISDYSSIFFDFLYTGKPVLFYIPDKEEYQEYRGLYQNLGELPGPATRDLKELAHWVNEINEIYSQYQDAYEKMKKWACPKDDGKVSKRILDIMLTKKHHKKYCVSEKKKLLIYAGELKQNGITQSLYSLLKIMDYKMYDVSLLTVHHNHNDKAIEQVDARTRVIVQAGLHNGTVNEDAKFEYLLETGMDGLFQRARVPKEMFGREYRRLFGDSVFDAVIEFTGYSPWYGMLFSNAPKAKKLIWQHSMLYRELERKVDDENSLRKKLMFVFSLYSDYHKIVGCSQSVMKVNRENIKKKQNKRKYTYARNTLNIARIQQGIEHCSTASLEGSEYYVKTYENEAGNGKAKIELIELPKEDESTFVSLGRLSEQKNYENLIQAFAKLQKFDSHTKLYVIGEGDLRDVLTQKIRALNLTDKVILTGNLENPFGLMKQADCFVLPSKYEGQPLVIQEARMLSLPIIMTDFPTGKDVYMEHGQLVVKGDADSLLKGMISFLEGKVPSYHFDAKEYNQEVYREFEKIFEE